MIISSSYGYGKITFAIISTIRFSAIIATVTASIRIIRFNFRTTGNTHIIQRILEDFSRIENNLPLDD